MTRANRLLEQEIKKAQPFARPICKKLVEIVYRADPALEVTTKWGKPTFIKRGMICAIWPFLRHVSFVFPNGAGMSDSKKLFNHGEDNLNNRMIKFTDASEVNRSERDLMLYVREAIRIDEAGRKPVVRVSQTKKLAIPANIKKRLVEEKLLDKFNKYPFFKRKGYLQWIGEARLPETREKRLVQMLLELPMGVYMNDRY